jgi:hypothetical protein
MVKQGTGNYVCGNCGHIFVSALSEVRCNCENCFRRQDFISGKKAGQDRSLNQSNCKKGLE